MTDAEFVLWRALSRRQLDRLKFRRQAPIGPYIVDFFCGERRLAIEVDGGQHGRQGERLADARRDGWLAAHGVRVIRFQNDEVLSNLDGVCTAILAAAEQVDGSHPSPKPAVP
ncbi:MAG: endonuclease domain-containing protein, partial [Bauldia sp.]